MVWHPFNSAHYEVPPALIRSGHARAGSLRITTTWSLLRHPLGAVVFDTGAPSDDSAADMPAGADVISRLARLGLSPADVRFVVNTHLHADHVGGNRALGGAGFLVDPDELAYARAPSDPVLEAEYRPEPIAFDRIRYEPLGTGDVDLFGDGTVILLATPGHAAGHRSVLLRLPVSGAVLVTGDAIWTRSNLEDTVLPGLLWNAAAYRRSRRRLRDIAERERARWFFSHEPKCFTGEGWIEGAGYR